MTVRLVDSHCHLDRLDLSALGGSLDAVMTTARKHDVGKMLCVSINLEQHPAMMEMVRQHDHVYASVGVHPNEKEGREPRLEELLGIAQDSRIIAIGETGLDYFYLEDTESPDRQQARYRCHIQAARKSRLPLIIHSRDAWDDTFDILDEESHGEVDGVLHCFTGDMEQAERALDAGLYISFSGIVTFRNAREIQEVAESIPLDRMLVETDSPYLTPVPYRGKPNQPAYVHYVADFIANLRGVSIDEIIIATSSNFSRLFHISD